MSSGRESLSQEEASPGPAGSQDPAAPTESESAESVVHDGKRKRQEVLGYRVISPGDVTWETEPLPLNVSLVVEFFI